MWIQKIWFKIIDFRKNCTIDIDNNFYVKISEEVANCYGSFKTNTYGWRATICAVRPPKSVHCFQIWFWVLRIIFQLATLPIRRIKGCRWGHWRVPSPFSVFILGYLIFNIRLPKILIKMNFWARQQKYNIFEFYWLRGSKTIQKSLLRPFHTGRWYPQFELYEYLTKVFLLYKSQANQSTVGKL